VAAGVTSGVTAPGAAAPDGTALLKAQQEPGGGAVGGGGMAVAVAPWSSTLAAIEADPTVLAATAAVVVHAATAATGSYSAVAAAAAVAVVAEDWDRAAALLGADANLEVYDNANGFDALVHASQFGHTEPHSQQYATTKICV
jgi:hypothetical protein